MADLKISALPPTSTPLAGTEVLPIVQSGTTRKVSVSDLTAGRAVSAGDLSYTGTLTGSAGVLNIGSGQLYKDANGRVGIATASPSTNLSVGDDGTSVSRQISLHGPASGTNNGASINVRNGTDTVFAVGNASNIIGGAYSSDAMLFWGNAALRFYGNGAERARIDSSGNTTINTGNLVVGTAGKGIAYLKTGGGSAVQPVFSATANTTQSINAATWTKVDFANELFDSNSDFASSTFTPTVPGYYQLNASVYWSGDPGSVIVSLYRSGNELVELGRMTTSAAGSINGGALVFADGIGQTFEIYFRSTNANTLNDSTSTVLVTFNGFLVRGA